MKTNPDYSQSAENLCNPTEVKELLSQFHAEKGRIDELSEQLRTKNESLVAQIQEGNDKLNELNQQIKDAIEQYGSYQDVGTGDYAVKYRRMSRTYHVEPFKEKYSKYASAVVEETISVKALEGLVKGGLVAEDELKAVGVITETPQYAFVIR